MGGAYKRNMDDSFLTSMFDQLFCFFSRTRFLSLTRNIHLNWLDLGFKRLTLSILAAKNTERDLLLRDRKN